MSPVARQATNEASWVAENQKNSLESLLDIKGGIYEISRIPCQGSAVITHISGSRVHNVISLICDSVSVCPCSIK